MTVTMTMTANHIHSGGDDEITIRKGDQNYLAVYETVSRDQTEEQKKVTDI
jgi:hypothetical protein